jgi:asparagine synthase (glutamine-hydrolysing)
VSGIAGIVALDGAPVDPALLDRMAGFLASRGPDGITSRSMGSAGFAHSLLRTGDVGEDVPQPVSVDGRTWIVADARIDGRPELVRALRAGGIEASADAPAAELILHALRLWGDAAPEHLLGDFAFAAWDGERRRLVCARDPFGVKPFYYAVAGGVLVFSGSLDFVRAHPAVPGALDDAWLADFLVHGYPQETDRTVYAAVLQLAPGHALVVEGGAVRVRRWWALPDHAEPLRLRGPREYVEAFLPVLRDAVRDRLPDGGASFFLSGGRDSTSLAALAVEAVARGERRTTFLGITAHYERLMPDREREFTLLAGDALGIPVRFTAVDDYPVFGRWEAPEMRRPQPSESLLGAIEADQLRQAAAHGRVLLTGQGGDAAFRETSSRLTRLALQGRPLRALGEAAQYAWWHGRIPRPGVRSWLRTRRGVRRHWPAQLPPWVAPDFARRVGIEARVAAQNAWHPSPHPLRPEAHERLAAPLWPHLFAGYDPGETGVPVEVRHPYFDLRVVRFLLSVPPVQWYNDKGLLRLGMRGRLPERLLRRPKSPLVDDPLAVRLREGGPDWLGERTVSEAVRPWIDPERVPRIAGGRSPDEPQRLWEDLRPLALSLWLDREAP